MRLKVYKNYLCYDDGKPFFYLGDTAWELFHKLTLEDINFYLSVRAKQGFNVIQAVALAEFDGLKEPNMYGRLPLKTINGSYSPEHPDTDGENNYWSTVDYAVKRAGELGLFIGFLPTWGDKWNLLWGKGPEIFTPQKARSYGKWIGERYGKYENIIWILGGDRPVENDLHMAIIDEMAYGLREGESFYHLMTYHPTSPHSSADFVAGRRYIDFHITQTGHRTDECYECWKLLQYTREKEPGKPYMDGEPRYEDHPACFKVEYNYLWNAADVRTNLWWNVLEGACGHTYGNHCVWSMNKETSDYFPYRWKDVLYHEGALTMRYARELRESRDYFSLKPAPELVDDNGGITAHVAVAKGDGYAYIYSPMGAPVNVHFGKLGFDPVKASWFNPRNGQTKTFAIIPGHGSGLMVPPSCGKGNDWVLILDRMEP